MLSRYTSDAMATIWSDAARYERWRQVELAVLAAQVRAGTTPVDVLAAVEGVPAPTPAQVEVVEAEVRHDVVAFLDAWTASMDANAAAHVHRHLTSSDTVDTAQACALAEATDLILAAGRRLVVALADRALEHRATLCVARTHGQAAAFDVFGHRFADFAFAVDRALVRLSDTRAAVTVTNISGPVGAGIDLPPELVRNVAHSLGLGITPTTTQVVFRDAIAAWVTDLALLGAVCEAVATDIRLGQHDGVAELAEPRQQGQEGSSAMPHKRNPINAESVTGIARLLRGYVSPAIEDIALWSHRDISHSSVERVVLPDAASLCEQAVMATILMVNGMVVNEDALRANIQRAGPDLISSRLQAALLGDGFRRSDAATVVRERIGGNQVSSEEIASAAAEVIESEALALMFDQLSEIRSQYTAEKD
jgi:adenylosuccinate lyase